jgi:hypothetical protein
MKHNGTPRLHLVPKPTESITDTPDQFEDDCPRLYKCILFALNADRLDLNCEGCPLREDAKTVSLTVRLV